MQATNRGVFQSAVRRRQIDLEGINFNSVHDSYSNGVLTVTDGTHSTTLTFNGSYALANFSFAGDGSGGTIVYDPPVPSCFATNCRWRQYFGLASAAA
jgi:hypothetical protein